MHFRCVSVGSPTVTNALAWDFDDRGGCTRMCRGHMGILYSFNFTGDLRMLWGKKKSLFKGPRIAKIIFKKNKTKQTNKLADSYF